MASGNPYEVYSAPPPSLSSATAGMGTSVMPSEKTYGQAIYQRYYALPFALDTVKHAIAASQRNPHVDQATALAADVAAMTKAADARAALVTAEVRKRQAARSQMNAVRLKAAGRSAGGGGFNAKELRLLIDLKGEIGGRISTAEGARLGDSGIKGLRETASEYGTGTGLGTSVAGAIGAAATTVGTNVGPDGMTESQLKLIAQSDADGVAAIRALKVRGTDLEKGDAAYTMAQALREASPGMSEAAAANFAAKTFGLDDAFLATGEGLQYVKNNLEREAKALMPAGKGEGTLLQTDALVDEAIRLQLNRKGGGRGGALGAEQRRQAAQQLSPEERADLKLYLGALQNDGEVVAGEMVSLAGQPARPITDTEIVAGKKAFQKAQKYDAYDAEDAQWFDEDFLRMHADKVDRSDEASEQRRLAFERGSRTPEEIQREMSEEFVRVATAARDLEDYIPLSATGINNGRDAKIIGGASHIARREGSQVFHLDQHHDDRQRRLGGRGPVASTPLRLALKAYQTQGGSENQGLSPEQMRAAGQVLTNRFRDPEKRTIALQYLLAMQFVNDKSAETGTAVPSTDLGGEAASPPPPPVRSIGVGASTPDVAAFDAPTAAPPSPATAPSLGGSSRAARPPTPAPDQTYNMMEGIGLPFNMMGAGESDPYAESPITHALQSPNAYAAEDARLQRREAGQVARDTLSRNFNAATDPVVGMLSAADRALGDLGSSPSYSHSPQSMKQIRLSGADMTPLPFGAGRGLDYSLVPSASPVVSAITPDTTFPTSSPAIAHVNTGNRQNKRVIPAHGEGERRGSGPIPALVPHMGRTTALSDMLGGHLGPSASDVMHKEDFGLYPDQMRLLYASTPQEEIEALFRSRVAR